MKETQKAFKLIPMIFTVFVLLPQAVFAVSIGDIQVFNIEPAYDSDGREEVSVTLRRISARAYLYTDDYWWSSLSFAEQSQAMSALINLGQEFDAKIYPALTQAFGDVWNPGIDSDARITVLFHPMKDGAGGYFNSGDEYPRIQNPKSNEKEMVYLNTEYISSSRMKSFLAHEFMHLITFNQKERIRGVSEEIWLNEIRAEYASTLLGYDADYQGSNLEQRLKQFINSPSNSLTEWQNQEADYGVINLFAQYLVDQYGIEVLANSLHSSKIGISSVDEALKKNNSGKSFSDIFTDWLIVLFVNNCQISVDYCYRTENLKNFRVTPSLIFLPSTQRIDVSLDYSIKQWSGNWYRIIGGNGDLKLQFNGNNAVNFKVPYVLCQDSGICEVRFLNLNKEQDGEVSLLNFGNNWRSLTLIPSIQSKTFGFGEVEPFYSFSVLISMEIKTQKDQLQKELLAKIEELKQEITRLQRLLDQQVNSCQSFSQDLYYGINSPLAVSCLQQFLKSKGQTIYPEGLVTGNYLSLTAAAVKRYQASKGIAQTGYFGPLTRAAVNKELGY